MSHRAFKALAALALLAAALGPGAEAEQPLQVRCSLPWVFPAWV